MKQILYQEIHEGSEHQLVKVGGVVKLVGHRENSHFCIGLNFSEKNSKERMEKLSLK